MPQQTWIPKKGDRCIITSVPHPAFSDEVGQEVTFLRHVPNSRWVWVDINSRKTVRRHDGKTVIRIRSGEKPYLIEHLSPTE